MKCDNLKLIYVNLHLYLRLQIAYQTNAVIDPDIVSDTVVYIFRFCRGEAFRR